MIHKMKEICLCMMQLIKCQKGWLTLRHNRKIQREGVFNCQVEFCFYYEAIQEHIKAVLYLYFQWKIFSLSMPNVSNCGVQISSENPDKCQRYNGFYVDKYHNYFKYYSKQEIHCYGADKNITILFGFFYFSYHVKCTRGEKFGTR